MNVDTNNRSLLIGSGLLFFSLLCPQMLWAESTPPQAEPTAAELFQHCASKYPGDDQRSRFTVLLRDAKGNVKKSEYLRIWKDFHGRDGVADKMILFTIFPPDAKGAAFMRVGYRPSVKKDVDQWIYLPVLKKIRRVSIRNPSDSFLNSNLTYADIGERALEMDNHRYLGVRDVKGRKFHVVESTPKEANPQYGKREFWFDRGVGDDWSQCVNVRIDYYDQKAKLLKRQLIRWQQVAGAWVWDRVWVSNVQTKTATIFQISGVTVNTGLKDELFSARTLMKGPSAVPKAEIEKDANKQP